LAPHHRVYSTEPAQKVRLELIFALDLFGSFFLDGKGTKKAAALWDHQPSRNNRNGASIMLDVANIQQILYFVKWFLINFTKKSWHHCQLSIHSFF